MNLQELFESNVNRNTARALAQDVHANMMDLAHMQAAGTSVSAGGPLAVRQLRASTQQLLDQLADLGFEYDPRSSEHMKPLTVDMPATTRLGEMRCQECGGAAYTDRQLAEKKDACYNKVRSRYRVWPSAYASGALVQCRKKGAANWGNKTKKESAEAGAAA